MNINYVRMTHFGDTDDVRDVEISGDWFLALPNQVRLIRLQTEHLLSVLLRINRHGPDAHLCACAENSDRNLSCKTIHTHYTYGRCNMCHIINFCYFLNYRTSKFKMAAEITNSKIERVSIGVYFTLSVVQYYMFKLYSIVRIQGQTIFLLYSYMDAKIQDGS